MLYKSLFASTGATSDVASRNIGSSYITSVEEYSDIFLPFPARLMTVAAKAGGNDLYALLFQQISNTWDAFGETRRAMDDIMRNLAALILKRVAKALRDKPEYYRAAGVLASSGPVGVADLGQSGTMIEPLPEIISDIAPQAEQLAIFIGPILKADNTIAQDVRHCPYAFEKNRPQCGAPYKLFGPQQTDIIFGPSLPDGDITIPMPTAPRNSEEKG